MASVGGSWRQIGVKVTFFWRQCGGNPHQVGVNKKIWRQFSLAAL
jgi:hypothetical protein